MAEIPGDVVDEVERLTRRARRAVDDAEAAAYRERRERLLAEHEYTARVREEDDGDVLVVHPDEWVEDGMIRVERIEDTDRAVERRLDGPGEDEAYETVAEHNRRLVEVVREEAGPDHAANAAAFTEFVNNHYVRRAETVGDDIVAEFLGEYYPRNVWPTEKQRKIVRESVRLVFEVAGRRPPESVE